MNLNGVDLTQNENVPEYLMDANAMINDPDVVEIYEKPHPMSADLETPIGNALISLMLGNMTAEEFVAEARKSRFRISCRIRISYDGLLLSSQRSSP